MVSFPALWNARPEVFAQAAARWEVFGTGLDARHDDLTRTSTAVGAGWEGSARDAAMAYLSGIAERIERARALVEQIPPVLIEHSAIVESAQEQLRAALAATFGTPIIVGPDGSVRIPPALAAVVLALGGPVTLAVLIVRAEAISTAIRAALRAATESDKRTTNRLTQLIPPSGPQTGTSGPGTTRIPPAGTSPQRVAQWWAGLSPADQYELIHTHPEQIGNLDGIPAHARDEANRSRLPRERATLQAQATRLQAAGAAGDPIAAAQLGQVQDKLRALDAIDNTLTRGDRQLLLLDTTGRRVKAAVAIGDVDTARHVTVFTPGFTSTVEDSLPGYDADLRLLREQAQSESQRFGDGGSVAAVTWIGYEAPQWGEIADPGRSVISEGQARAGGTTLGRFLDGVDAARPDDPHLTAIGHSYGSSTTGYAVQQAGAVDDAIFFGSPGIGTSDVHDLHVAPGHSYVIEARDDPVADLGRFGEDPNQLDGLTDLSSGAARTPDGRQLNEVTGHSNYLAPDSTSQYNISTIVAGVPDRAVYGENSGLGDHARKFLDDTGDVIGGAIRKLRDIAPGI
ncbi:MAG TPA: alpha/beta hydrolase [Pseudonocardiaceae bacterium]